MSCGLINAKTILTVAPDTVILAMETGWMESASLPITDEEETLKLLRKIF